MRNFISQCLLVLIFTAFSISNAVASCETSLNPQEPNSPSTKVWAQEELAEKLFGDVTRGWSLRGFLGTQPEMTPENILIGIQNLVMPWGLRIYPVRSVEEALAHNVKSFNRGFSPEQIETMGDSHYTSPPDMPVYILVNDSPDSYERLYLEQRENKSLPHKVFHEVAATTEVFYFDLEGQRHILSKEQLAQLDSVSYNENNPSDHFFYQFGWFAPKFKGVESINRFMTSGTDPNKASRTYSDMSKKLRTLFKRGLRITFNRDMDQLLILAGTQERIGSNNKVARQTDPELSRFNKKTRDGYLELQAEGHAYSVEVWDGDPNDPNTHLLGGTFGRISGTVVSVDSLAYVAMRKVRNYNENKEPLFLVGEGLLLTYEKAVAKGNELKAADLTKGLSPNQIQDKEEFYTPQPSYVWEDPRLDQTNSHGEIEYLLDENGEIKEIPRGEFADFANLALYEELKKMGIDITDVGMVTPKSHQIFKARYVSLEEALPLFQEQDRRLRPHGQNFVFNFPEPNQIYKPVGLSNEEFTKILKSSN